MLLDLTAPLEVKQSFPWVFRGKEKSCPRLQCNV
jgi:hypothetical protein